jgi:hypothetical protein
MLDTSVEFAEQTLEAIASQRQLLRPLGTVPPDLRDQLTQTPWVSLPKPLGSAYPNPLGAVPPRPLGTVPPRPLGITVHSPEGVSNRCAVGEWSFAAQNSVLVFGILHSPEGGHRRLFTLCRPRLASTAGGGRWRRRGGR